MRIVGILLISILLMACSVKEEKTKKAATPMRSSLVKPVKLPVFKDKVIANYVTEYDKFVKEYLVAIKNKDTDKIAALQEQSIKLTEKAKKVSKQLNTPAKLEKFQKWLATQQQKIEILTTK